MPENENDNKDDDKGSKGGDMQAEDNKDASKDDKKEEGGAAAAMGDMAGKANPMGRFGSDEDAKSDRTFTPWARTPTYEPCCCCFCHCSDRETKDVTCCGCFPIRCGVLTIGIITVSFTIYMFCASFFQVMNEYIKWWFPFVSIILMTPAIIGSCNYLGWFTKDCARTRSNLAPALILHLITWSLVICWQCSYFLWMYKNDTVYQGYGTDTESYQAWSKKGYIFWLLAEASVAITLIAYFLCVVNKYTGKYAEGDSYYEKRDAAAKAAEKSDDKKEDPEKAEEKKDD